MDISHLSQAELQKLIDDADQQIKQMTEKKLNDAYLLIIDTAKNVGLSLEDLIAHGESRKLGKPVKEKTPVKIKYRHTLNQNDTWTGRGKKPRWLVAELEKGAKLEDFLI